MRKNIQILFLTSLFIFHFAIFCYANSGAKKENKHKWEFSTAASLDIDKESNNGDYMLKTTISLPFRIGYFLNKNLEIEPEISYIHVTVNPSWDGKSSYSDAILFANIVFNITTTSQVVPFILAGGGIVIISRETIIEPIQMVTNTYSAFDAGIGLKWYVTKRVALRPEYRFMYYKENADKITHHKLLLGISIFF